MSAKEICPRCERERPNVGPWKGSGGYDRLCGPCKCEITFADSERRARLAHDVGAFARACFPGTRVSVGLRLDGDSGRDKPRNAVVSESDQPLTDAELLVLSIDGPFCTTPRGSCRADAERLADRGYLRRVGVPSRVFPDQTDPGFVRTPKGDRTATRRPPSISSPSRRRTSMQRRRNRKTGTHIVICESDKGEIEEGLPWMTLCEEHGYCVCHATLNDARSWAAEPDWCEDCQALMKSGAKYKEEAQP